MSYVSVCVLPLRSVATSGWPSAFTSTVSCCPLLLAPVLGSGHLVAPTTSFEVRPLPPPVVTPYTHSVVCPPPPVSLAVREVRPAGP
jgi:hypothetical protein